MKLDKDLVRDILLAIEADPEPPVSVVPLDFEGRTDDEIAYHVMLLDEAGLIEAMDLSSHDGIDWRPKRLTYQGHELLDTIRDPEVWSKTKAGAEKAGVASLGFLWEIAKGLGKSVIATKLGIAIT